MGYFSFNCLKRFHDKKKSILQIASPELGWKTPPPMVLSRLKMYEFANLRDDTIFPPFTFCPDENDISLGFYTSSDGFTFRPKRHWCLLAEITGVDHFIRLRLFARDRSGSEFHIAFYLDDGQEEPDLSCLQVGHTLAILYPQQHSFLDLTVGIRQEVASFVKVIPLSLRDMFDLSDRVQTQAMKIEGKRSCHACGKRQTTLLKCSRCNLCWYCDRKCQEVGWRDKRHKDDCRILKDTDIQGLFALDWENFDDFVHFPLHRS